VPTKSSTPKGVDRPRGLNSAEAAARARRFGLNELAAAEAESRWHVPPPGPRPDADRLLAAGAGSIYPLRQLGTGVLVILLTLFNAVMNLQQEGRAGRPGGQS
jgi:Ca2+-transporting ATPase